MSRWIALTPFLLAAALASPLSSQPAPDPSTPSGRLRAMEALYPPWQHGANNDAADRGFEVLHASCRRRLGKIES